MFKLRNVFLAVALLFPTAVLAQESVRDSSEIEGEADKLKAPSSAAFEAEKAPDKGAWSVRESLDELPDFFKDTTLKVNVRNFYFAREDPADAPGNDKEKISWAQGGSLLLKSGKLAEVFSLGAQVSTSQRLYGPLDKDGALLLEPEQEGYTVIGVANPKFEWDGQVISLYRQRQELPFVNSQENRMTPNTFEGYSYAYLGDGEKPPVQFGAGYIDKIKKRNTEDFVSMSEGAGVSGHDRGMPWLGARLRPVDEIKAVGINYYGIDFLNTFYSDAEYALKLSEDWALKSSLQFADQRSVGDDLLLGDNISTSMWGVQQALSYRKFMVRAAVTVNDKGTSFKSPFGSYAGYNSSIVEDFNRAGEIAWKLGLSYDFAGVGIDGLSAYADYIHGSDAVDDNLQALADKSETDVNTDYRFKEGALNGLWLRLRGGFVEEENVGTGSDFRVIVNYDFQVI